MATFNKTRALEIAEYFTKDLTDPVNIVPIGLTALCLVFSGKPRGLAWWALLNAAIIHIWMDFIIGIFARGPKWMVIEYGKLDTRYWPTKESMVVVISTIEAVIMGPLSLVWYHAIVREYWYRHFIAIVVSCFHMMGAFLYFFAELYDGCKHIPYTMWPPTFTEFNDLFYFWFIYVFANSVWVVIPSIVLYKTFNEMHSVYNAKQLSKKKAPKWD